MAKAKTVFFCNNCGYESAKWLGKCPACESWNTFSEEIITKEVPAEWAEPEDRHPNSQSVKLDDIKGGDEVRISVKDQELRRVLGGGLVPGSVILIGGEPGIGKSTLMLQLAADLVGLKTLYVSGEESNTQIKMRADRMKLKAEKAYFYTETSTQKIFKEVKKLQPDLLIVDSIQTVYSQYADSPPGSIGQIRQCTSEIIKFAKETNTPALLVGHITKEGSIAGPKVLEHMVDTVLQFEGDRHFSYRILRTIKNRFGSTSELGIYEMTEKGLSGVINPAEVLISQKEKDVSGVSIASMVEGNRPLLIETQALVSPAIYGNPQRSTTGFDTKRLNMLLAVLERRCSFRFGVQDVFLNMAGGIRVTDPAVDLAICAALVSSMEDLSIPSKACFAAEIGLGGELRAVSRIEQRIAEAEKLGYSTIYISKFNKLSNGKKSNIEVKTFGKLTDVFSDLFG